MKICTQCHEEKPLEAFSLDDQTKDGRYRCCRICRSINRGGTKLKERFSGETENTKRCSRCKEIKSLDSFTFSKIGRKGRYALCRVCTKQSYDINKHREWQLKKKYGISLDDYAQMFQDQNGRCAICGTLDTGSTGVFFIDHNHQTGKIRALLCHSCNTGLGYFKENIENLLKAVNYLRLHGEEN